MYGIARSVILIGNQLRPASRYFFRHSRALVTSATQADKQQRLFVRKATLDDKEDILALGSASTVVNVDRLAACYDSFLQDPRRHCYVIEESGKLVAYSHAHLVDDDVTLAFHDVRTGEDEKARDTYRFMLAHITLKAVQENYPSLETATVALHPEDKMANLDAVYKVVGKQKYLIAQITPDDLPTVLEVLEKDHLDETSTRGRPTPFYLTPNEAVSLATRVSSISSFFGGDRILIMGESYRPTQENFISARGIFKHILATFDKKKNLCALSFGNSFLSPTGSVQTLDVFSQSRDFFLDHLKAQMLHRLTEPMDGTISFYIQVPAVTTHEEVMKFCRENLHIAHDNVQPVCDLVLGELSCKSLLQAAAAHLASDAV